MESFTHTRRLADYLEMAHMGPSEFKRAVNTRVPRELAYQDFDTGKIENARELLQTEGLATTNLIPTEVYATVVEGSEPARCMRDAIPIYRMPSHVMTLPYGETGTYAGIVAEGAEIPIETETISVLTLTADKYAVRPMISREMVNDAKFDVIANEIRKAGYKIENALNRCCIDAFITAGGGNASTYQTDTGGSGGTPTSHLGEAVGTVIARGFMPTDIILHPTCYGAILGEHAVLNTPLSNQSVSTGSIGTLYGCKLHLLGVADNAATYTWGWTADGYFGGLVIAKNQFGAIGMREDINVEQYSDPVRDLVGMKVAARFDAGQLLVTAGQYLQY
jgi:HK97 family phage major capsid protein